MGYRTDGVLGAIALGAFAGALVAVEAPLSPPFLALGAAGTAAFELVAFRRADLVRDYWERASIQVGALGLAFVLALGGAAIAPSIVLSAGIGAVGAYLLVLGAVLVGAVDLAADRSGRRR